MTETARLANNGDGVGGQVELPGNVAADRPATSHPVGNVKWVPLERVRANSYNPNKVAAIELRLLYTSIKADGYTQPVVTVRDETREGWIIVDGFHRWRVMVENADIRESTGGLLPIVEIDSPANDLMASTIRHNRARGKHSIGNMSGIVFSMLDNGWSDERICAELGMSADELLRLKHMTGFSKLFENVKYRRAWETRRQLEIRRQYQADHPDEDVLI
jgi:ParB-like chromosome segregation protein Spo0J